MILLVWERVDLTCMRKDDLTCIGKRLSDLYFNFDCFRLQEV